MVGGTTVADTEDNRAVLETIEQYRQRLVEKNVEGLLLLASDRYFEDSGTPSAVDDYGYEGLKFVLANRLTRLRSIRYDIQYRSAKVEQTRAEVEVFLSGAFEIIGESRDSYRRIGDHHRFVVSGLTLIMALLVAQTRVESGVHSSLEVVYGGALGAIVTLVVFQLIG